VRTSFELKVLASDIDEAKDTAITEIARFLKIDASEVEDHVSIELKVSYPKAETIAEIEAAVVSQIFQVLAYGSVKQSVARPFGF
jgi:hypothetical protein